MRIFEKKADINTALLACKKRSETIGFVATMGALHQGHVSLIKQAKNETKIVVCSIFVNPTQFNDKKDLERYPRPIEEDKKMLAEAGCNILFLPSVEEMYPEPDTRVFDFDNLDKVMEGARRPGHFNGVAQIVSKLFETVMPDKAYFGQKDFQQQTIIRALVKQLSLSVEIVACPIVREENGLAMSSRNKLLSVEERGKAGFIHQELLKAKELIKRISPEEVKEKIKEDFLEGRLFSFEYFEIADIETLSPVKKITKEKSAIACIAVKLGNVRLIDNIFL